MQIELLSRLKESGDETDEKTEILLKTKEELQVKTRKSDSDSTALKETTTRLVDTEESLQKSELKLNR